jgi:uncharacterized phage-associated protein
LSADRIHFQFDERKATEAAALLIEREGGRINYMKLLKLMYLAERRSLAQRNRPICGDVYVSMSRGPVLSKVYNLIKGETDWIVPRHWSSFIRLSDRYFVELVKAPDREALSDADVRILSEVFAAHGSLDEWQLVRLLHEQCPEWEDPADTSSEILPEEILRALGKDEEDMAAVRDGAEAARSAAFLAGEA